MIFFEALKASLEEVIEMKTKQEKMMEFKDVTNKAEYVFDVYLRNIGLIRADVNEICDHYFDSGDEEAYTLFSNMSLQLEHAQANARKLYDMYLERENENTG